MTVDVPKIDVALICDDIRREVTGKDIVIGIYGDDILVGSFPIGLTLGLYLRARFPKPNTEYSVEFRVIGTSGQQLVPSIKSTINSQNSDRPTTLAISGIPIQVQSPGSVEFQWRPQGSDWETIAQLGVKQGGSAPTGFVVGTLVPSD